MKINGVSMRMLSVVIALMLLVGVSPCSGSLDEQMTLSFDSVFPSTPYKDALGACMQVLGYLDQLCHEHDRAEQMSFGLVHDAFLGKVVIAQQKVTQLTKNIQLGAVVTDDNVNYLSAILGYISQLYQERIAQEQRNALAISVLNEMTMQVLHIIEG